MRNTNNLRQIKELQEEQPADNYIMLRAGQCKVVRLDLSVKVAQKGRTLLFIPCNFELVLH